MSQEELEKLIGQEVIDDEDEIDLNAEEAIIEKCPTAEAERLKKMQEEFISQRKRVQIDNSSFKYEK